MSLIFANTSTRVCRRVRPVLLLLGTLPEAAWLKKLILGECNSSTNSMWCRSPFSYSSNPRKKRRRTEEDNNIRSKTKKKRDKKQRILAAALPLIFFRGEDKVACSLSRILRKSLRCLKFQGSQNGYVYALASPNGLRKITSNRMMMMMMMMMMTRLIALWGDLRGS